MTVAAAAATATAFFFFFFVYGVSGNLLPPVNDDVLSLIVFKSSVEDPMSSLSTWNEDEATPCSWAHVECGPVNSRVVRLALDSLSLAGRLPRGLERMQFLESLSLAGNNLSGEIPPEISLLPRLRTLDLSRNAFSGRIPDELGAIPTVRSLDLSGNSLSGPIPAMLFSTSCASLRFLSLANNHLEGPIPSALSQCSLMLHLNMSQNQLSGDPDFSGTVSKLSRLRDIDLSWNSLDGVLPESISDLYNLKVLRLNANKFTGTLPVGLGLCLHLNTLDLSSNEFTGELPESLRHLKSLTYINMWSNQLTGELPAWIGNLSSLQYLDFSSNKLVGHIPESLGSLQGLKYLSLSYNQLAGKVPTSLARCSDLTELHLKGNGLEGSIPPEIFDLGLEELDISSNKLTGPLPPGSTRISETLQALDLSDNQITGVIPPEMALYFKLRYFNLSWNNLKTRLPPELGYFRNLSVLDLRNNEIFGPIPADLCESGNLAVVQLDGNALTGHIPDEIGNCSSLHLLSLSHNELNGSIPSMMSLLKKLEILKLEFNNLTGEIPPQLGELENLLVVNISHNQLIGRLPVGGIFPSLDQSALQGNLGLCTPLVAESCKMNVPKPLVLDPNAYRNQGGGGGGDVGGSATMPSSRAVSKHRRFLSISAIIAISAALIIVMGVVVVSLLNVSARRRIGLVENPMESMCSSSSRSFGPAVGKLVLFPPKSSNLKSEDMIGGAESLLAKATEIGRGVFGTVYRAAVGEGRVIAVKKLFTANIVTYHDDFDREVRALGKARHPNLMALKGYYWTPQIQLLITDYAGNGNLDMMLHRRPPSTPPLSWSSRFKIALGTAKGLAHLHQSFRPPIIHYNIKPSNVLLDEDLNPKISDFGLARLLPKLDKHVISSRFQSAMGYVAPELACQSLRINEKCDVYGFGVLLLELVTGRKPVEYGEDDVVVLIDQVRAMLEQGNALEAVDGSMVGQFPEEEVLPVLKLGLVCTSQIPSSRPTMAEVVKILQVIKTPVPERMIGNVGMN